MIGNKMSPISKYYGYCDRRPFCRYWMFMTVAYEDGGDVSVITNDQSRDHRLGLLLPRPFLRWRSKHCRSFRFSHPCTDSVRTPSVSITPSEAFSFEMQCSASDGALNWHIPIQKDPTPKPGSLSEKWLCVRFPNHTTRDSGDEDALSELLLGLCDSKSPNANDI